MYQTHKRWWTVADAARLLRVHTDTLYDAVRNDDFPHERWGAEIRIPCEALRMTYVPSPDLVALARRIDTSTDDFDQLALPLDPSCLVPTTKRYRNGERKEAHDYERRLWSHNRV